MGIVKGTVILFIVTLAWYLNSFFMINNFDPRYLQKLEDEGKYPWFTYVFTVLVMLSVAGFLYDCCYLMWYLARSVWKIF